MKTRPSQWIHLYAHRKQRKFVLNPIHQRQRSMGSYLPILFMFGIAIFVHTYIYKYLHVYMRMIVDAIYLSLILLDAMYV